MKSTYLNTTATTATTAMYTDPATLYQTLTTINNSFDSNKIYYNVSNGNGITISNHGITISNQLNQNKTILNFYKILKDETPYITNVKILNPNKVIQFTFSNEEKIKTICSEKDNFNFEFAFYLAYAKYIYHSILTPEGIENKAKEFMTIKFFNKLVEKGIKTYQKQEKERIRAEALKKEQKEIKKRRIEKKIRYKNKKKIKIIN